MTFIENYLGKKTRSNAKKTNENAFVNFNILNAFANFCLNAIFEFFKNLKIINQIFYLKKKMKKKHKNK